ncbi:MAG: isoprenyl transferase [Bacteroidota bacterium]|nr:isoprenyl transferase [Bacteroidota bacterium]
MEDLINKIDKNKLPSHVAIIMDGNGRWAKQRNKERVYGHQHGAQSVRNICEIAAEIGVKYLTLYTFSKENWARPKQEVDALMQMLIYYLNHEEKTFMDNQIRLTTIGDTSELSIETQEALTTMMDKTKNNKKMTLVLALNYSSKWELVQMVKRISEDILANKIKVLDIDEDTLANNLCTKDMPDVDLLIRTSGEERISNFMLWQIAYSELYFTDILWPDFSKKDFCEAILDYQKRERRYGKTSEQISEEK